MFTGIIEGLGTIAGMQASGRGRHMSVSADFDLAETGIGASIAVNGACLTVVTLSGRRFEVDLSPETQEKTTFGRARIGDRVNLERALRLSDRLDGHLVSGHIDGIGTIRERKERDNAILLTIGASESLCRYMIRKGSVAVDGVSLTINDCGAESFQVSIIPHTAKLTTVGLKRIGDPVNLETDMIGKYVERFLRPSGGVDMNLLSRSGFM